MADKESEVEVTKLSNKVLIQLKKAFGMSAEDKFEAKKIALAAAGATGKAVKLGGAALVGGTKGLFSGIGKFLKAGMFLAIVPLFKTLKWIFTGIMRVVKLPSFLKLGAIMKGGKLVLGVAFKWILKPFFWIAGIWQFIKGWKGAKDLNNDNVISWAEKFYQGLG